MNQGIFKKYQKQAYNCVGARRRIYIERHIKLNNPFMSNIAYEVREHSYDNQVTQLIRHTIEYIMNERRTGTPISSKIAGYRNLVNRATPSYQKRDRIPVIRTNHERIVHPYYTAYEPLRRICLKILSRQGLAHGRQKELVHGLLFEAPGCGKNTCILFRPAELCPPEKQVRVNENPHLSFR